MMVLADIAQEEGAVFSCNTNKVEATFGYGTLNGDLRGSFAPWFDLVKGEVYQLANYMNQEVFKREVIPRGSIDIAPMDELSVGTPGDPFDYGDGIKNGYHDEMVRAFVEFRKNPEWFLEQYKANTLEESLKLRQGTLQKLFRNSQEFIEDLERCWKLFYQGYFKRIQAVPFPVVSKRAYGSDYQEAFLGGVYYTQRYKKLKKELSNSVIK
jgi:NAD+ synthase (glutamine-hydrolysing)